MYVELHVVAKCWGNYLNLCIAICKKEIDKCKKKSMWYTVYNSSAPRPEIAAQSPILDVK